MFKFWIIGLLAWFFIFWDLVELPAVGGAGSGGRGPGLPHQEPPQPNWAVRWRIVQAHSRNWNLSISKHQNENETWSYRSLQSRSFSYGILWDGSAKMPSLFWNPEVWLTNQLPFKFRPDRAMWWLGYGAELELVWHSVTRRAAAAGLCKVDILGH